MEELIQLINDLKANRIEKEYMEELRSRLKSLQEQLNEIEVKIADQEKELRDMEEEKTEDLQVFSPFINSPKQLSFQVEKQKQLSESLESKRLLDESISYLQTKLEEHTYVFDYIVSVQKKSEALINEIIDANSENENTEDENKVASDLENDSTGFNTENTFSEDTDLESDKNIDIEQSELRRKLEWISSIIVSDPIRARIQLIDLLSKVK